MANIVTSFSNDKYDVTIWENRGKYEMEIEILEEDDKVLKIEMNKYDIMDMIKGFAGSSTKLAKEMITEIVEEI